MSKKCRMQGNKFTGVWLGGGGGGGGGAGTRGNPKRSACQMASK